MPDNKFARLASQHDSGNGSMRHCTILGCGRPTVLASGKGLAACHCRYHIQHRARHGSHWHPTYRAADIKPYLQCARRWIRINRETMLVKYALIGLSGLLEHSGPIVAAQNLKRRIAIERARVAFARLREAGIEPERLLAIHMAVHALIEDDMGSHRVREFRIVQVAKAAHRLASGTHKRWDFPLADGRTAPLEMHIYPKSSGRILRVIGEKLDDICEEVTREALEAIRESRKDRFGPHPSQLPGWRPLWQRQTRKK